MNGDKGRNAESALELVADLGARALRSAHDNGDILADLLADLNDVEAV